MSIALITFDFFGTVVDWRRGLREALAGNLTDEAFERVIDRQGELEQEKFRSYAEIVAQSLREVVGFPQHRAEAGGRSIGDELDLDAVTAARIGGEAGKWPLFPDSAEALRRLRSIAPCAAITNSDLGHGAQVQAQLGFSLDGWICAEETRTYKPDPEMWRAASRRMRVPFSRDWWHVSAYADYDLAPARALGLTCVFVRRPHSRLGPNDLSVENLNELADLAAARQ